MSTSPAESAPTIGALFAGYGGLELAARQWLGGGDVRWYAEKAKAPALVLAHRFPDVPNLGDVTTVDWSGVEPVDVITGGTPCQDLSHAGPRGGMTEGTRSNLWVAMREAIAVLRPRAVIWENVRGALSARADSNVELCPGCMGDATDIHLRALGRVLGDLADLRYNARWHGVRASDVGAPHIRWRVFVLAYAEPVSLDELRDAARVAGTAR
jgi:DNA (cytosine-5)-methyltransferase 1